MEHIYHASAADCSTSGADVSHLPCPPSHLPSKSAPSRIPPRPAHAPSHQTPSLPPSFQPSFHTPSEKHGAQPSPPTPPFSSTHPNTTSHVRRSRGSSSRGSPSYRTRNAPLSSPSPAPPTNVSTSTFASHFATAQPQGTTAAPMNLPKSLPLAPPTFTFPSHPSPSTQHFPITNPFSYNGSQANSAALQFFQPLAPTPIINPFNTPHLLSSHAPQMPQQANPQTQPSQSGQTFQSNFGHGSAFAAGAKSRRSPASRGPSIPSSSHIPDASRSLASTTAFGAGMLPGNASRGHPSTNRNAPTHENTRHSGRTRVARHHPNANASSSGEHRPGFSTGWPRSMASPHTTSSPPYNPVPASAFEANLRAALVNPALQSPPHEATQTPPPPPSAPLERGARKAPPSSSAQSLLTRTHRSTRSAAPLGTRTNSNKPKPTPPSSSTASPMSISPATSARSQRTLPSPPSPPAATPSPLVPWSLPSPPVPLRVASEDLQRLQLEEHFRHARAAQEARSQAVMASVMANAAASRRAGAGGSGSGSGSPVDETPTGQVASGFRLASGTAASPIVIGGMSPGGTDGSDGDREESPPLPEEGEGEGEGEQELMSLMMQQQQELLAYHEEMIAETEEMQMALAISMSLADAGLDPSSVPLPAPREPRPIRTIPVIPEDTSMSYERLVQLEDVKITTDPDVVLALPTTTVTEDKIKDLGVCSICQCEYEAGDTATHLPCQHNFHDACVSNWLLDYSRKCPVCKIDVTSPGSSSS